MLERIKKIRDVRQANNAFARLLGIESLDIGLGCAKRRIVLDERHFNPLGGVHGGCLYSLADNTGGDAAASYGNWITTTSGSLNFLNPAINLKEIICEARCVKAGKNIKVVNVEIFADDGRLLANGSFSYFDMKKPIGDFAFSALD